MNAFAEDLKRWMDPGRRPAGATPSPAQLRPMDVVRLFWRYPAVWPTGIYRLSYWLKRHRAPVLPTVLERANLVLFGIEISSSVPIGPGLYIAHPVGTVLMAKRIGANASFISSITLGMRETHEFPVLGDGVKVGAGARILGGIKLGDDCTVGANAVVIKDVPPGATAVGVPARLLSRREQPEAFTESFRK